MQGGLRHAGTCLPAELGGEEHRTPRQAAGGRRRLCRCRDKMPSWCETAQRETDRQRAGSWFHQAARACRQASRQQKRKERRAMERAKEELNGKGAAEGRHKSLSRARRSVSRRMSPGPGRIDSFLQQPARKKCFTVLQDTDSSQLMFLRVLN